MFQRLFAPPPRTRIVAGFTTLVVIAVVAACSDRVTGVKQEQLRFAPASANNVACTNSWKAPVSGRWDDVPLPAGSSNWTAGHPPRPDDHVCITIDGNYGVSLAGGRIKSLTVGTASNTGRQSVGGGGFELDGGMGTLLIEASGSVNVFSGVGLVLREWVNRGTFTASAGATFRPTTPFGQVIITNTGRIIADNTPIHFPDVWFEHLGGTIELFGQSASFRQERGFFRITRGSTSNELGLLDVDGPAFDDVELHIDAASVEPWTLKARGATQVIGNVRGGQTLIVENNGGGANWMIPDAPEVTNDGLVLLRQGRRPAPDNGLSDDLLVLSTLRLVNRSAIAIEYPATLMGSIVNAGTPAKPATISIAPGVVVSNNGVLQSGLNASITGGTWQQRATAFMSGSLGTTFKHLTSPALPLQPPPGPMHIGGSFPDVTTGIATLTNTGSIALGSNTHFELVTPTQFDRIAGGQVVLGGALTVVNRQTSCVTGTALPIIQGSSVTGGFNAINVSGFGAGYSAHSVLTPTTYSVVIDGPACTPPVITPMIAGTLGNNGWYTSDVTVSWQVVDDETVTSSNGCEASTVTSDHSGVTFTCSATSFGGTATQSVTIKRDATAPVITSATRAPAANSFGWNNGDVTGVFSATDAMSGIDAPNATKVLSTEGAAQVIEYTFFDRAGNSRVAQVTGVSIDKTAPTVSSSAAPAPNAAGWNNGNVIATFSATDGLSGIPPGGAVASQIFTDEGVDQGGSRVFTDRAGNSATATISGISIDKTAPEVSATRAPAANAFGWNNENVTATYGASDALSGLAGDATASETFSAEGANQSGVHTFTDKAGNSKVASISGISIDRTAPQLTTSRAPAANVYGWSNSDVTGTWLATDALSGIPGAATQTHLFTDEAANQSATRSVSDRAGNTASAEITGVSIDKTAPEVTVTREPPPNESGYNTTDVTVTYSATDALSGLEGDATFVQVFTMNGLGQAGTHSFLDKAGNLGTGTITGINIVKTPLAVSCSATPSMLAPPNNRMVPVHVTLTASRDLTRVALRSVTSGDGSAADVQDFTIGAADFDGQLRAARGGGGDRVYLLLYDVTDVTGETASCTARVTVPHDQRPVGRGNGRP